MKSKQSAIFITVGLIFIVTSIYPLFLIVRENILDSYINSRYKINEMIDIRNMKHQVDDLAFPIHWKGKSIEVIATDTGKEAPQSIFDRESKRIMQITIKINGKEESYPVEAWLPHNITKFSDYLSWLNIVNIKDNRSGKDQLAIVQRLADNWRAGDTASQRWRILFVDEQKQVTEENFTYLERGDHVLGVKLVMLSSQSSSYIGYKSDLAYTLPSIFFPLLYPTGSFILGIVFLIVGYVRYKRTQLRNRDTKNLV